jgi:hypothetical protein
VRKSTDPSRMERFPPLINASRLTEPSQLIGISR